MMSWSEMSGKLFIPHNGNRAEQGRVAVSSLLDLESKYNRAIEEKTMLEQEIISREELEIETQRLRDEIRGELTRAAVMCVS
jgi:hypothetical protein